MAQEADRADLFQWRRFTKTPGSSSTRKVRLSDTDIKSWMKRVEVASERAVLEVFSGKKAPVSKPDRTVSLHSVEQLQDHDDAYAEAQALLSDWMNQKMRRELELDEDDEDLTASKSNGPSWSPGDSDCNDLYSKLAEDDDAALVVDSFLRELMDGDVSEFPAAVGGQRSEMSTETRHRLAKERRARRDAERERRRGTLEARRQAQEEARRLVRDEQRKSMQEARRQEELLQLEVVRLRRLAEEKRSTQELAWKMQRETLETLESARKKGPDVVTMRSEVKSDGRAGDTQPTVRAERYAANLQCMHKHFSAWYSAVLEKRVLLGKAAALCDWRMRLRAWRAWRALVWLGREEREVRRTEHELRLEHKRRELAEDSDRRRLLRRCLTDWRSWCLVEKDRKELLQQQEVTRKKMAALIDAATAAAAGRLEVRECTGPDSAGQSEDSVPIRGPVQRPRSGSAPSTSATQAWQVTRRHVALIRPAPGSERRHVTLVRPTPGSERRRTIAETQRLPKERQEMSSQLPERRKPVQLTPEGQGSRAASRGGPRAVDQDTRSKEASGGDGTESPAAGEHASHGASRHPVVRAMEERARQREERRREVQDTKRRKEEETLARMKAEDEERRHQEEEERRIKAVKRREERRRQEEKELEKQRRTEREQKLLQVALEHYNRSLVLHRGIEPWTRLVQKRRADAQKAAEHHEQVLQRRCLLVWCEVTGETAAEKKDRAERLYDRILLRRALHNWEKFRLVRSEQTRQAERFHAVRTHRKIFLALRDHMTQQNLVTRDNERLAAEHDARRRARRCFDAWTRLPETLRQEREREARRDNLRRKVAEILPDFGHVVTE